MSSSSSVLLSLILLAVTSLLLLALRASGKKRRQLPPGPWGLPVIGHLHLLGRHPHRDLQRLAATYGPVLHLRMGPVPLITVSSPAAAKDLFQCHDLAVAGRLLTKANDVLTYKNSALSTTQYGPYRTAMHKLFTSELFARHKIDSFAAIRHEEVRLLVADLAKSGGSPVDMTAKVSYLIMDMACLLSVGSKGIPGVEAEEMRELRWLMRDQASALAALNFADFFPIFGRLLERYGIGGKIQESKKTFKMYMTKIEERMDAGPQQEQQRSLIDALVSYLEERPDEDEVFRFTRNNVKVLVMETITTIIETVLSMTEWAFIELLRHPEIMKKAQEELENTVGIDRMVEESDLANLPFMEMVLKESTRLHTPLPLLIPRMAVEDFTLHGFDIPRGSTVLVNAWAIARDPVAWVDPERFWPERFLESMVDFKGHDFELLPFGTGRRICAGMTLGLSMVRLILAQLLHCFDWDLPDGITADKLNMEESYRITAPRADRLVAIPKYRLRCEI